MNKADIEYTIKHKELNYNVFYSFKIGIDKVKYTYVLTYNSNNYTYYVGEYNIIVDNYYDFTHKVQDKLLKYIGRNKKEISTINPNFILMTKFEPYKY